MSHILIEMKRKFGFIFLFIALILAACSKKDNFIRISGPTQGTSYSIIYEKHRGISKEKVESGVKRILRDIDYSLSIYNDSSVISKLNRGENIEVGKYFKEVFDVSQEISELTDGAFDITVGPLVRAWGFGPNEKKEFDSDKLDSLLNLVGYNKVRIENNRLVKDNSGIILDLNAIAQGYTADVISRFFDSLGVKNYLVEIGGEVKLKGTKNGKPWRIGIDRPFDNNIFPGENLQAIIDMSGGAVATSGNYRKYYIENGIKYSHTIDPVTGYPVRNRILSATVIADKCSVADGVATACMVMGIEKSIEFMENHPEFEAYFVYSDDSGNYVTWMSESLKNKIVEE